MMSRAPHKHIPEHFPGLIVREDSLGQRLFIEKKVGAKGLALFFAVFSIFWNITTWGAILGSGNAPLWIYFTHVPVGIITGYLFFVFWLGTQSLEATRNQITISSRPLPWFGNKSFNPQNLHGITTRRYHAYSQNDEPIYLFKVVAIRKDFQSEDLLKGLQTRKHALKAEELLEKFYRIQDDLSHDEDKNKVANL